MIDFRSLLLVLALAALRAEAVCSNAGYTAAANGKCYKVYSVKQDFVGAEAQCVNDGGHLASLHAKQDGNVIQGLLVDGKTVYLGLKCTSALACTWTDKTAYDYNNFQGGQANVPYGACVTFAKDGFWYSADCDFVLTTFICQVPNQQQPGGCGAGESEHNGGCVALRTTAKTWTNAQADCAADGGNLISIHSDADAKFYKDFLALYQVTTNVFIGFKYDGAAYKWSDGSDNAYTKWASHFPNTRFGLCVQQLVTDDLGNVGEWMNAQCETPQPYICMKPGGGPSPTLAPRACPKVQFLDDEGTFYSPGFPVSFDASLSCEYLLTAAAGSRVYIKFPRVDMDIGSGITLSEGTNGPVIAVVNQTTYNANTVYSTTGNIMKMMFVSSKNPTGAGWEAEFSTDVPPIDPTGTTITPSPPGVCPRMYYTADTTIYSPGWPGKYGPNLNCTYVIQSPTASTLQIIFASIDTEQCCDLIFIYDGPSTTYPQLGIVSGQYQANEKQFTSTRPQVTVSFITDSNDELSGWSAQVLDEGHTPGICGNGWTYSAVDNRCYQVFTDKLTFIEALAYCRNLGAELASIHNAQQNAAIYDLVNTAIGSSFQLAYIGVQITNGGADYRWSDGTVFDYNNWFSNPLPNSRAAAMSSYSGANKSWNAITDTATLAFVCYGNGPK